MSSEQKVTYPVARPPIPSIPPPTETATRQRAVVLSGKPVYVRLNTSPVPIIAVGLQSTILGITNSLKN